jgi:hypothetical protein
VVGVIGGPTLQTAQPGGSGHSAYWWLIFLGVPLFVVSLAVIVIRTMVRRR